jgi:hypothetical protein
MDDPTRRGEGGVHLSTDSGNGVVPVEQRTVVPYKMEKTMGGGGSMGLDLAQSRAKQKGVMWAAHR